MFRMLQNPKLLTKLVPPYFAEVVRDYCATAPDRAMLLVDDERGERLGVFLPLDVYVTLQGATDLTHDIDKIRQLQGSCDKLNRNERNDLVDIETFMAAID